ncbi:MAG: hypothetical protein ACM35G_06260 [Planctomycetaceae bacterium]
MILIGTDEGIYRWFEGCGWPVFHSLQDRAVVDLDSPGAGILAAVDRNGVVLESVNNGQDWRTIPLPEGAGRPSALAVWGTPGVLVLATRPLGLLSRPVGAPAPRPEPMAPHERAGSVRALFSRAWTAAAMRLRRRAPQVDLTTSGWSRLRVPDLTGVAAVPDPAIRALSLGTGESAPWLAAIRGAGLWRSVDRGTSWQQCLGLPAGVNAVRTNPKRPGTLAAATSGGFWISGDDGRTWEQRSGGLEDAPYLSTVDVRPDEPDVLMAGAAPRAPGSTGVATEDGLGFALFESTDGGKSWSLVRRGIPESFGHDAITDVRFDPDAPDNIVVALASGELWVSRNAGAYFGPLARQIRAARALCAVGSG